MLANRSAESELHLCSPSATPWNWAWLWKWAPVFLKNNAQAVTGCHTLPLLTLYCCQPEQKSRESKLRPCDTLTRAFLFMAHMSTSCLTSEVRVYLKADILQVIGVPFDNLFYEVWVCGPQIWAGWLVQLKLKAAPQLRHVKGLVPAPAHLWGHGKAKHVAA